MQSTKLFMILLTGTIFLFNAGCSDQQQPATQKAKPETTAADVKKEAKELMETAKSYTMEQQQAYQQQLADKFATYGEKIDLLKQHLALVKGDAEKNLQAKIDMLQAKIDDMKTRADEMKNESGMAWEDLKKGIDKAGEDLDKSFDEAMQNFAKPPANN